MHADGDYNLAFLLSALCFLCAVHLSAFSPCHYTFPHYYWYLTFWSHNSKWPFFIKPLWVLVFYPSTREVTNPPALPWCIKVQLKSVSPPPLLCLHLPWLLTDLFLQICGSSSSVSFEIIWSLRKLTWLLQDDRRSKPLSYTCKYFFYLRSYSQALTGSIWTHCF